MEPAGIADTSNEVPEVAFSSNNEVEQKNRNLYSVEDSPPCMFSFLHALQILICQVLDALWLPLLLSPALCLLPADPIRVYLVSTALLTSGVVTCLQSTLGVRLPAVVTPSILYTNCFLSLLQRPDLRCPSSGDLYAMGPALRALEWQSRLREVQGALLFAGICQALLGISGVQASLCRILSPVSVAPAVILAGLSVPRQPLALIAVHWHLFFMVALFMILFAMRLQNVFLPLPTFSTRSGITAKCFPFFRMFPVLWTCVAVYLVHEALSTFSTTTNYPDKEVVAFQEAIDNSKWFFFSFPFEWGLPTLSMSTVTRMLPAIMLQSVSSMMLFYGSADVCGFGKPPRSAMSRGLTVEGLGLMVGSLWGHGVATNPANIGLMSLTGVVSRSSTQLAALIMISLSHFTRFASMLAGIPINFLSAIQICLHAGLVSVGISLLRFTNFTSVRDSSIVALSLFLGLTVPQWVSALASVDTGLPELDNFLFSSLTTSTFVGAVVGVLLDILLPGRTHNKKSHPWKVLSKEDKETYRLPSWEELLCSALERIPCFHTD